MEELILQSLVLAGDFSSHQLHLLVRVSGIGRAHARAICRDAFSASWEGNTDLQVPKKLEGFACNLSFAPAECEFHNF